MTYDMHVDLFFPFDPRRPHLRIQMRSDLYNLTPEAFADNISRKLRILRKNATTEFDNSADQLIGWRIWRNDVVLAQWGKVS